LAFFGRGKNMKIIIMTVTGTAGRSENLELLVLKFENS